MRVLLLAQFYPPVIGGEERHVRNLAIALAARGLDVHVATFDTGALPQADPGVNVHLLDNVGRRVPALYPTADRPLALPLPDPLTTAQLNRLVRDLQPDVVHAHNWIINSWLALPAARRIPLVYSLHDYSHVCATKRSMYHDQPCSGPAPKKCFGCARDHYGTARGPVIQAAVRGGLPIRRKVVDFFAPVSRYVADANQLPGDGLPYEVVPNFIPDALADLDSADVSRDPALPAGDYIFFAGDLSAQKGVPTLIEAWQRMGAGRPELVVVGRPAMPLDDLPVGVHVHHHWEHARVISGFVHATAAALPSVWPDPCPTTVLEALALGVALATTDRGGIADMVVDEESALVVPPGDVEALSKALTRLCEEPDLRERLGARAKVAVGPYRQSAVAEQLHRIYAGLV